MIYVFLSFANCHLNLIDQTFFTECNSTKKFNPILNNTWDVTNCKNEILPFENLTKTIEIVKASGNSLLSIEDQHFEHATNLLQIDLTANFISNISCDAFKDQKKLTHLYLNSNKLTRLTPGIFDDLAELQELRVQSNGLTVIEEGLFDNNRKLVVVDLNFNKINAIGENSFEFAEDSIELLLIKNSCADSVYKRSSISKLSNCFKKYDDVENDLLPSCHPDRIRSNKKATTEMSVTRFSTKSETEYPTTEPPISEDSIESNLRVFVCILLISSWLALMVPISIYFKRYKTSSTTVNNDDYLNKNPIEHLVDLPTEQTQASFEPAQFDFTFDENFLEGENVQEPAYDN